MRDKAHKLSDVRRRLVLDTEMQWRSQAESLEGAPDQNERSSQRELHGRLVIGRPVIGRWPNEAGLGNMQLMNTLNEEKEANRENPARRGT